MWRRVIAVSTCLFLVAACTSEPAERQDAVETTGAPRATPSSSRAVKRGSRQVEKGPVRSWAKQGQLRLADVRAVLHSEAPIFLTDLSADERSVAFMRPTGSEPDFRAGYELGVIDLDDGTTRVLVSLPFRTTPKGSGIAVGEPIFAPDGSALLFQDGASLRTVNIASGSTDIVARTVHAYDVGYGWLSDGRIAFLDPKRRLMFARPGGRSDYSGITIPNPPGHDDLVRKWALDPSGQRVLYWGGAGPGSMICVLGIGPSCGSASPLPRIPGRQTAHASSCARATWP